MSLTFLDVENLAGAFTLAGAMEGLELVGARRMPGAFGLACLESNRHLVRGSWTAEVGTWQEWSPADGVAVLTATPPCAGFSALTYHQRTKNPMAHGPDARQNECMHAVIEYARSRVTGMDGQPGAEVVVFESVQGAYKQGRELMRYLAGRLGDRYRLWHVLLSTASVGGTQYRPRYFFVASRVPLAFDPPQAAPVTVGEAIGDLRWTLSPTNDLGQLVPYHGPTSTPYQDQHRTSALVTDGCAWDGDEHMLALWDVWPPETQFPDAVRAAELRAGGRIPWPAHRKYPLDIRGLFWPSRVDPSRLGRVLHGGGVRFRVHWADQRYLTLREGARLMGLPDDWRLGAAKSHNQANAWLGKAMPIQNARWLLDNIVRSLLAGTAGRWIGEQIAPRERVVDVTQDFRRHMNVRARRGNCLTPLQRRTIERRVDEIDLGDWDEQLVGFNLRDAIEATS